MAKNWKSETISKFVKINKMKKIENSLKLSKVSDMSWSLGLCTTSLGMRMMFHFKPSLRNCRQQLSILEV